MRTQHQFKDMDKRTIYPQEGLQLRRVGKQYMIVKANENNVNMSDVYSLNRTAARMWERLAKGGCTADDLATCLCEEFDTDQATALQDVERQLSEWKAFGLIL